MEWLTFEFERTDLVSGTVLSARGTYTYTADGKLLTKSEFYDPDLKDDTEVKSVRRNGRTMQRDYSRAKSGFRTTTQMVCLNF